MAIFRRKESLPVTHPVTDFWAWWASEGRTISPHEISAAHDQLTRRVQAINPELTWNFGPGASSEHRLTVTAGGDAELRPSAERWLRAAPASDATWEFRAAQEAEPEALQQRLELGEHSLDLAATRFVIETDHERRRADVGVFHPKFGEIGLDASQQVTYLVLDWTLGEDAVERWVGAIDALVDPPSDAQSGEDLRASIAALDSANVPEEWAIAEWTTDEGRPGLAMFRIDIRWIDLPTFDVHHVITATYAARDNGLPTSESLDRLRELEGLITTAIGGRGVLIAHETSMAQRTFHVYSDGDDQNVSEALHAAVTSPDVAMTSTPDPGWREVRRFTG